MVKKGRINTTFDKDLWEMFRLKEGNRRSQIMEDLVREYLFSTNNIDELKKEIEELEKELTSKKNILKRLLEEQKQNDLNHELIDRALKTVQEVAHSPNYCIGENQIESIAGINGISKGILIKEVRKIKHINIVPYYEP